MDTDTYKIEFIEKQLQKLPPFLSNQQGENDVLHILAYYGGRIACIDNEDCEKLGVSSQTVIDKVDNIIDLLSQAEEDYLTGQSAHCYEKIYELIFESGPNKINLETSLNQDINLYRMRACTTEHLYSREEMFHIPFDKRRLVGNQRFSISGYPCLYLGSSLYLCWEELNRPSINTANVVKVKPTESLRLLDLRMPDKIKEADDLFRIPLIMACSIKTKEPDSPFKPEYIIPQAVLHALVAYNEVSDTPYDGIIYYSTHMGDSQVLYKEKVLFENIVIPSGLRKDKKADRAYRNGFCPGICNRFEISDPISLNTWELRRNVRATYLHDGEVDAWTYQNSRLGVLESYLSNQPTYKVSSNKYFRLHPSRLKRY